MWAQEELENYGGTTMASTKIWERMVVLACNGPNRGAWCSINPRNGPT